VIDPNAEIIAETVRLVTKQQEHMFRNGWLEGYEECAKSFAQSIDDTLRRVVNDCGCERSGEYYLVSEIQKLYNIDGKLIVKEPLE